jgi:hypothetical protein
MDESVSMPMRTSRKVNIPTFRGRGLRPGIDLDNSARLLTIMERDRDSLRRGRTEVRTLRKRHPSDCK